MASPVIQVVRTYELLEKILLNLSTENLFGVQRVSSGWKDVITRSHPIQKRMFLLAEGEPVKPMHQEWGKLLYKGNLYLNPAVDFDFDERENHGCTRPSGRGWPSMAITDYGITYRNRHQEILGINILNAKSHRHNASDVSGFAPDATHKNMLLTQPPITAIEVHNSDKYFGIQQYCVIYNPAGLTFRDMWEGMRVAAENLKSYSGLPGRFEVVHTDFSIALPLEDEERQRLYEQCTFPEGERRESCSCTSALFGPSP